MDEDVGPGQLRRLLRHVHVEDAALGGFQVGLVRLRQVAGEADAALVPTFAPEVIVRAAPDRLALPFAKPLSSASAAIGVRKGDFDFVNFLESWLAVQRDEGWLDERTTYWADTTNWLK